MMKVVKTLVRLLIALVLVTSAAASRAQSADAVARARTHFQAGRALYDLGNYTDAIREFSAGYQLVPKPQFLINLGQSYRKLGDLERARDMYKRFLADTPPDDPDRGQAKLVLADIEKQIAARPPQPISESKSPPPPPAPGTTTAEPKTAATPTATPTPASSSLAVTTTPPPPEKKSFVRRHWWIFPVGAVVLAGAAVGIYFGVRPAPQVGCGEASLGCIDVRMGLDVR
jgi:hypothetical protein